MFRRIAAVGVLTLGSLIFAIRFRPPPESVEEAGSLVDEITVEAPPPPRFTKLTVPSTTTTTLPPGVEKYQSGIIRFERRVLQLQVTLTREVITDIEMIRIPSGSERAKEINTEAHPLLRAEALEIQDYRVHIVSGATETSLRWARALRNALEQSDFCLLNPRSLCDTPLD
jgi:uncharacterized protein with FMN-binding domain